MKSLIFYIYVCMYARINQKSWVRVKEIFFIMYI